MTPGSKPWQARYTEEAHRLNLRITTHALGVEGIDRAVRAGLDMIEHCGWVTADGTRIDPEIAARMAEAGTAVCPTTNTAWLPDPCFCPWDEREHLLGNLRAMLAAGVEIVAGTDAGIGMVPFPRYADVRHGRREGDRCGPHPVLGPEAHAAAERIRTLLVTRSGR
ncbi:MAG: hypothetical protein GEV11_21920 [Streptosporangiales bacterium]|nr:hypothetical protein [Streptosporangiales bacterium]